MNRLTIGLALLALSGCSICRNHETACAAVTLVAVGSIALSMNHSRNQTTGTDGRDYTIGPPLTPNCNVYPEMCK